MSTERNELDRLAGEYVLGLLGDEEETRFEGELFRSANARAALREARERFAELDATAPAVEAPAALWDRIESELVIAAPADLSVARARRARPAPGTRFWHGFATAAAAALVIAAVGVGAFRGIIASSQPQLIVVLLNAEAQPGAIVEAYNNGQRVRVVPLQRFQVPDGKTLQVWTLWSREVGPVSVGLVEGSATTTLSNNLPEPRPNQFYEITLEQAGGSPTGKPTGPVLAKGFARQPQI